MEKLPIKDVSEEVLKENKIDSVLTTAYILYLDAPLEYLQRKEPGFLMSFNITNNQFYEAALCLSGMQLLQVVGDRAFISATVSEPYFNLFKSELSRTDDVYVVLGYTPETNEKEE